MYFAFLQASSHPNVGLALLTCGKNKKATTSGSTVLILVSVVLAELHR